MQRVFNAKKFISCSAHILRLCRFLSHKPSGFTRRVPQTEFLGLVRDHKSPLDTILTLRPPDQTDPDIRYSLRLTRFPGQPLTCIDRPYVRLGNRLLGPVFLRTQVPDSWEPHKFYSCQLVWHPDIESLVVHEENEGPLMMTARSLASIQSRGFRRNSLLRLLVAEGHLPEKSVTYFYPSLRCLLC